MRKSFCIVIFLFLNWIGVTAKNADTIRVVSHHKTVVVTDPVKGSKSYTHWAVFPNEKQALRRINLKVTFGCPDSLRCADWDYLDHIIIRRKGGVNSPSLDYPIGRMLTPYGGAFARDWSFEWSTDITDFSLLLRDSVEIEYQHTGFEPADDRGWKITVEFEMVKGIPSRIPVSIAKIYDGSFEYGNAANDIEQQLKPISFYKEKNATDARLVIFQTGHGMDAKGCGEFCSRFREVWFNNRMIDKRDIWKSCGDNPLYPQAGTWTLDRAHWCPGYLQHPDVFDLNISGAEQHTVDINMEPYVAENPSANEMITAYLVQYRPVSASQDVAVEDILVPTNKDAHARYNPSAMNPVVIIRNLGTTVLKECVIEYGTIGTATQKFKWKGNLPFMQTDTVRFAGMVGGKPGINQFQVLVTAPNGQKDAFPADNKMISSFTKVPIHGTDIILHLLTNKQPQENSYLLKDATGKIWYKRKPGSMHAETHYRDSFRLAPGAYELLVKDSGHDGLEYWFNTRGGSGFIRLLDTKGRMLKSFESDFGSNLYYSFEVSEDSTIIAPPIAQPAITVFPTRTRGKTTMTFFNNTTQTVVVQLVTDPGGEIAEQHVYENLKEGVFTYDLSYRPAQRYYLKVFIDGQLYYNKRVRVGQ